MVAKKVLPVVAGFVAMPLPVLANLIALLLPVLTDLLVVLLPVVAVLSAVLLPLVAGLSPVVASLLPILASLFAIARGELFRPAFSSQPLAQGVAPFPDRGIGRKLAGSRALVAQPRQRS